MSNSELDKYYTKSAIADACLEHLIGTKYGLYNNRTFDLYIEPSAGSGSFVRAMNHQIKSVRFPYYTSRMISMDIDPPAECENGLVKGEIEANDWLYFDVPDSYNRVMVYGNPPFGRNHSLSDAFIKHAMSFPNVWAIAFILPNTYKKPTRQRILPSNWRIASITPLEDLAASMRDQANPFVYEGEEAYVPCSFFVFDRFHGPDLRFVPEEPMDFHFANQSEVDAGDFDFFVYGTNPSKVITDPKPNNRGYYIKVKDTKDGIDVEDVIGRFREWDWSAWQHSCASGGVAWMGKDELANAYNHMKRVQNDQQFVIMKYSVRHQMADYECECNLNQVNDNESENGNQDLTDYIELLWMFSNHYTKLSPTDDDDDGDGDGGYAWVHFTVKRGQRVIIKVWVALSRYCDDGKGGHSIDYPGLYAALQFPGQISRKVIDLIKAYERGEFGYCILHVNFIKSHFDKGKEIDPFDACFFEEAGPIDADEVEILPIQANPNFQI